MSEFAVRESKVRVVTPEQFAEGYVAYDLPRPGAFDGGATPVVKERRRFVKIRDLPGGDILVKDPR